MELLIALVGIIIFLWVVLSRAERRKAWLEERGIKPRERKRVPQEKKQFEVIEIQGRKYTVRKG